MFHCVGNVVRHFAAVVLVVIVATTTCHAFHVTSSSSYNAASGAAVIDHHHHHYGVGLRLHPDQAPELERYANELFQSTKRSDLEHRRTVANVGVPSSSTSTHGSSENGPLEWCRRVVLRPRRSTHVGSGGVDRKGRYVNSDKMP